MDDSTLEALRQALRATPQNRELALILIRACLERADAARGRFETRPRDPCRRGA
jgi:hypothetical protein